MVEVTNMLKKKQFISNIEWESINQSNIPDILEKNVVKNIAKYKEISLAVLMHNLAPLEKALNRKFERNIILNIVDKYIQNGLIKKQYLKFQKDLEPSENTDITQKGNT